MLFYCESIRKEDECNHAALILLFDIFENIISTIINDFNSRLIDKIKKLKETYKITDAQYEFLSNSDSSIRNLRNIFMHKNLTRFNILFKEYDYGFPLTENTTCRILYDKISPILFNLIFTIQLEEYTDDKSNLLINIDKEIEKMKMEIVVLTPRQILKIKGWDEKEINKILVNNSNESEQYRLAENSSDINIYAVIFKEMFK